MVLDADAQIGMPASEYFKLESDTVFEIGLTPNRSDAMSHLGVARDLMTVLKLKVRTFLLIDQVWKISKRTTTTFY